MYGENKLHGIINNKLAQIQLELTQFGASQKSYQNKLLSLVISVATPKHQSWVQIHCTVFKYKYKRNTVNLPHSNAITNTLVRTVFKYKDRYFT